MDPAGAVPLKRAWISVDTGLGAAAALAVRDLHAWLQDLSGQTLPLTLDPDPPVVRRDWTAVRVHVGAPAPQGAPSSAGAWTLEVTAAPAPAVGVWGADEEGLGRAVTELATRVRLAEDGTPSLPPGRWAGHPRFPLRGMYAHLHWQYAYPYALRTWQGADWRRYVDLLARMGFNLLQIWPMAGMLPLPLEPADRVYLEMYREVVDHARQGRGMRVWCGECANNVARSGPATPITRREYFAGERLLDPRDPPSRAAILANRAELYRVCREADGFWVIDADPGGWPESPTQAFVDLLVAHRRLLVGLSRADAELVYWMQWGWGTAAPEDNIRRTLTCLRQRLAEPWGLLAMHGGHLDLAQEAGLLPRTVYFPYGAIEPEPSTPLTRLDPGPIRAAIGEALGRAGLRGVMGNAQTPLVQLPHMYLFSLLLWESSPSQPEASPEEWLGALARLVSPRHADILVRGWRSLEGSGGVAGQECLTCAEELAAAAEGPAGPPGWLGRCLPSARLLSDLATQLRIRGCALRLQELGPAGSVAEVQAAAQAYLRTALDWQRRHGYRAVTGGSRFVFGPYAQPAASGWTAFARRFGHPHEPDFQLTFPMKSQLAEDGYDLYHVDAAWSEAMAGSVR